MKIISNNRGSALILVLFLVALIGVFSLPLLLTTSQGAVNTKKGGTSEQAYYMAESGALVVNRAITEAFNQGKGIRFDKTNLQGVAASVNGLTNWLYSGQKPSLSAQLTSGSIVKIVSLASVSQGAVSSTRQVEINFVGNPGSEGTGSVYTDPETGIFGVEAVRDAILPKKTSYVNGKQVVEDYKLAHPNDKNKVTENTLSDTEFKKQFNAYIDAQMAARPLPLTPLEPFGVSLNGKNLTVIYREPVDYDSSHFKINPTYTLNTGTKTISASQGSALFADSITFTGSNQTINITGDIISGTDIVFNCQNCTINISGNLVAKNSIQFSSSGTKLTINGNMVSGGRIVSSGTVDLLSVGKSISAAKDIYIGNDLTKLAVGDSMIAGTPDSGTDGALFINPVSSLQIGGYFSSLTGINFNNDLSTASTINKIGQSMIAGKDISFKMLTSLQIGKSMSSKTQIYFGNVVQNLQLLDGSIIAGGNVSFTSTITNLTVNGSISTPANINFNNTMDTTSITGTLYAGGTINFGNRITSINTGSIYSTAVNINNDIDNINVNGSFLTKGSLSFKSIGKMNVTNFLGAIGNISFTNNMGDSPVPLVGGITTSGTIQFADWSQYDNYSWLNVQYNPPGGAAGEGSSPTLNLTGWKSN